jgi:cytochrome c biogenesis protein CcdA
MKRLLKQFLMVLFLSGAARGAVLLDFFYEPGCRDCERIEQHILPEVKARFGDSCVIQPHDIGVETNFLYLLRLEDAAGHESPERPYLVVEKQHFFGPQPDVEALCSVIFQTLETNKPDRTALPDDPDLAERKFREFSGPAILLAGLLDGINPCAVSTLVFFMSLLAVFRVRNRHLLALGASYCLASFAAYLALGFGLLRLLHLFAGFTLLRSALERGMIAVLLVLAVLSFRDAVRYRSSRDGHDVTLQLSSGMKNRIHRIMRRGLKIRHLVWGGLLTGTLVTALESVCTGQVYVPTLVLILKNSRLADSRAWFWLMAYNLLFILPLILTFVAVYFGLRTETLLRWSRKNVPVSKTLLGLFFLLMALLIPFI